MGFRMLQGVLQQLQSADLTDARNRGAELGRKLFALDPKWKHLAIKQIDTHLEEPDPAQLARRNYEHYGQILAELACFQTVSRDLDSWFEQDGLSHKDAVQDGGLIISAHLGNWEMMGMHHTRFYQPLAALVKPIANPYISSWINDVRRQYQIETIVTRNNALAVNRALKEGKALVTLADQNSLYHEGVFVKFMGKPVSAHYGPAMLALRNKVPVITAFCQRTTTGKFKITYQPPLSIPDTGDLRTNTWLLTQELTSRIEAAVRQTPDQWFWIHRRWKNQPRPQDEDWKFGPDGRDWVK